MTTERPAQLAVLPDPSGLLACVMANPDEDDPRLRYADWLEEQEVASVLCPTCSPYADDDCPRCDGRPEQFRFRGPGATNAYAWECPECKGTGKFPPGYHPQRDPGSGRHEGGWANCQTCNGVCGTPGRLVDTKNQLRAEYIRLFFELRAPAPGDEVHEMTRKSIRQTQLWVALFEKLVPPHVPRAKESAVWMDRGFIKEIRCPWEWWARNGDALRAVEWVPRVKLSERPWLVFVGGQKWRIDGDATSAAFTESQIHGKADTLDWVKAALALRWPGTTFELPPE